MGPAPANPQARGCSVRCVEVVSACLGESTGAGMFPQGDPKVRQKLRRIHRRGDAPQARSLPLEINTFRLFVDGGLAVSVSMLMAVLINDYLPLKDVQGQDGVVILFRMLLCPCALLLYGGTRVIFAAYEAHKKKAATRSGTSSQPAAARVPLILARLWPPNLRRSLSALLPDYSR